MLRNRSSLNLPRSSASAAMVRFSRTVNPREKLVDLVALGQAELADVGDVHAGDVAPSNTILPEVGGFRRSAS